MNTLKILLIMLSSIGFISCATHQSSLDRTEYQRGYNSAWEFAKNDAIQADCFLNPRYADQEAQKKYTQLLRDQGRSESYIKGFYSGYEEDRLDFYDLYCVDYDPTEVWPY
jgi:hypothetical protein